MSSTHHVIASRQLCYSKVGESQRNNFAIIIGAPYLLTRENADIPFSEGASRCQFSFENLPERGLEVTGMDTFQAVELAIRAVEPTLRRLRKKYNFYFRDGEPYFED